MAPPGPGWGPIGALHRYRVPVSVINRLLRAGEGKVANQLEEAATAVAALEPAIEALDDAALRAKTDEFRRRLSDGETLDDLMHEAFAVVREASRRVTGMRPFDVQVQGATALHRGMVIEMRTGEGKTLVATMPSYLNALSGEGVHVVTVNDYLAARDAEWMGEIHRFLGLTVGLIQAQMAPADRRAAYAADITYGTNNEFGFDYLRDNMAMQAEGMVKRGHHYAIVDEVDSILIDEARTPLIISGRVGDAGKWYREFARISKALRKDDHYEVDEKKRQVITTEEGVSKVEQILGVENMFDHTAVDFVHHLDAALKAKELYEKDVEYLVEKGEVKIVDEFTGRVLEGRRYSEGLHQAIEAKEGVHIREENQTLATITLQNYFRMYEKLAGMTGTAQTEAMEFKEIYDLDVTQIPTNKPIARADEDDLIYKTMEAKFDAIIEEVLAANEKDQPVLIGTISIERSEALSKALKKRGIAHEVLNAKNHAREADIIAQAGRAGAVTVATNMAGRGVDIKLGGDAEGLARSAAKQKGLVEGTDEWEQARNEALERFGVEVAAEQQRVLDAGGLYIIGTERHDSRRIDNQLRGRSGRQGDPGLSRFFISVDDDLMRRFAGDRIGSIMETLRQPDEIPISHKLISRSVERAQSQVESQNFEIRKNVLKYDEVLNTQREVIYNWRSGILLRGRASELVQQWSEEVAEDVAHTATADSLDEEAMEEFSREFQMLFDIELTSDPDSTEGLAEEAIEAAAKAYEARREELGEQILAAIERRSVLMVIDNKWREHLAEMDYLRAGINLRAMGNRDPLVEYQNEAYDYFAELMDSVARDSVRYVYHARVVQQQQAQEPAQRQLVAAATGDVGPRRAQPVRTGEKIGRNDPCSCGSGKKFKKCHGAN